VTRASHMSTDTRSAPPGTESTARPSNDGTVAGTPGESPAGLGDGLPAGREDDLDARLSGVRAEAEAARLEFLALRGATAGDDEVRRARRRWDDARARERQLEQLLLTLPGRHEHAVGEARE